MHNPHILNTRPSHQSDNLTRLIEKNGGTVFHLPVIEIQPILFEPIKPDDFDVLIFLSSNAAAHFFLQCKCKTLHSNIIAIGSATQKTLHNLGFNYVIYPDHFNSESILTLSLLQNVCNKSIAIISGENPKPLLKKILTERGATVESVYCYQRKPIAYNMDIIFPELLKNKIDTIISTSFNSFFHLMQLFEKPEHREWILKKTLYVISDAMKAGALAMGFQSVIQAENATDEMIAKATYTSAKNRQN